jgi:hypothetical protein
VGPPCPAKIRAVPANYLKLPCPISTAAVVDNSIYRSLGRLALMFVTICRAKPLKIGTDCAATTPDEAVDNLWISPHYVLGKGLAETVNAPPKYDQPTPALAGPSYSPLTSIGTLQRVREQRRQLCR